MRLSSTASAVLPLLAIGLVKAPALAQSDTRSRDDNYFVAKLMLGVAGSVETSIGSRSSPDDAELSFGGGVAYMVPLKRYFALGGQLAVQSWRSRSARVSKFDRDVTGDLVVVPQGRLPLTHAVELYVSLPIGGSLDFLNEYHFSTLGGGGADADPALGFALSILAGARFALGDHFGLLAEAGYTRHIFSHDVTLRMTSFGATSRTHIDVDVDVEQFAFNVGVWF